MLVITKRYCEERGWGKDVQQALLKADDYNLRKFFGEIPVFDLEEDEPVEIEEESFSFEMEMTFEVGTEGFGYKEGIYASGPMVGTVGPEEDWELPPGKAEGNIRLR